MSPKISVVMPVYNGAATLGETMESILGQSEPDFEVIVVDDGSTDDTVRVLESHADPRVRVLRNETNLGITRSLIQGCAAARGRYIARHDAGDLSLPARLARQSALLDASGDVAFVACWTEFTGPELEHLFEHRGTGRAVEPLDVLNPASREDPMLDGPPHHGSVMFRRDAYERAGGYRAQFYYGQDWDLWYRLALQGRFQIVPAVLYRARISPGSISVEAREAQTALGKLSVAGIFARHNGEAEEPLLARAAAIGPVRRRGRSARAEGFYFIGETLRRNGDVRARRYLRAAVAASPLMVRAWVRFVQSLGMRKRPEPA